ncbi:YnbE family lipoprotein [Photobacterium leiognathi]|uniref:YnbE family lipoprotein n=1 Tax=Photobacterium leiognathi TaxID=553611 RepID=UPI00298224FB|nr:YnbE family lipoprotein [Photobacterium leiognathi]
MTTIRKLNQALFSRFRFRKLHGLFVLMMGTALMSGCTPKVEVALSEKPIEINLNINIKHEINVKADHEINELFKDKNVF